MTGSDSCDGTDPGTGQWAIRAADRGSIVDTAGMGKLPRLRRRTAAVVEPPATPAPEPGEDLCAEPDGVVKSRGTLATRRRASVAATSAAARAAARSATTTGTAVAGRLGRSQAWLFIQAAHPRQGLLTAFGVAAATAFIDRPIREIIVVFLTVLVGQTVLGWHNDLIDRERDSRHVAAGRARNKPIGEGRLDPSTVWFALACAVLLLIPLSVSTGITAGSCYLLSVGIGALGHLIARRGIYSWVPWAGAYALLPAYVAFGGWGGRAEGQPPEVLMIVLFAALGVGVHTLRALFGLVADHQDGWSYWPLRLSLRLGATRMLAYTGAYLGVVTVAIIITGATIGLRQ